MSTKESIVAISTSTFAESSREPIAALEQAGFAVRSNPKKRRLTEDEIIDHIGDAVGLLAGLEPLTPRVFSATPNLRAIARVGIGLDNVDIDAAKKAGIDVSNTPVPPANAVAELTVTALLNLCRKITPANHAIHNGKWQKFLGRSLCGLRILIVGFGQIGKRTAQILRGFDATILVYDVNLNSIALPEWAHPIHQLNDGLQQADVVSLHASGNDVILKNDEMNSMRDGCILLNSARGELVDEQALIAALDSGKISAGWFDAFWNEPYNGALLEYEQMLLTPHMGTYTAECRREMEQQAVSNLLADLSKG